MSLQDIPAETSRDDDADKNLILVNRPFNGSIGICKAANIKVAGTLKKTCHLAADGSAVLVIYQGWNVIHVQAQGVAVKQEHHKRHGQRQGQTAAIARNVMQLLDEDRTRTPVKKPNFQKYIDRKMPEPVSTIGLFYLAGYAALNIYARGGSAVSSEARAAQEAATVVIEATERSQVLFGEKAAALSQLWALAAECDKADWDGAGAALINVEEVLNAESIVRTLPTGFSLPEFAAEPDGSVSFDWTESRSHIFSVSACAGS
jgi:hypothetical protein